MSEANVVGISDRGNGSWGTRTPTWQRLLVSATLETDGTENAMIESRGVGAKIDRQDGIVGLVGMRAHSRGTGPGTGGGVVRCCTWVGW